MRDAATRLIEALVEQMTDDHAPEVTSSTAHALIGLIDAVHGTPAANYIRNNLEAVDDGFYLSISHEDAMRGLVGV